MKSTDIEELVRKTIVILGFVLGLGFLSAYSVSIYIHRNDGRFILANDGLRGAIDTRTGQLCLTTPPSDSSTRGPVPVCKDLQ
jgi:hypothetical protein